MQLIIGSQKMTKNIFKAEMKKLCTFFDKPLNEGQLDIWFECLKSLPDRAFEDAVDSIIRMSRFFPTPEDFLTFYRERQPIYKLVEPDNRTVQQIMADLARRNAVLSKWREDKDINTIIEHEEEQEKKEKLLKQVKTSTVSKEIRSEEDKV